jgi:2-keto-4-pentenoate hydratase
MTKLLFLSLLWPFLIVRALDPAALAAQAVALRQEGKPWSLASTQGVNTLDQAYEVQSEVVKRLYPGRSGFKAGLTTPAAQQKYKVPAPLFGVLPSTGRLASGAVVDSTAFHSLKLEMEVAFILTEPITARVASVQALVGRVRVAPAIELPDLAFSDPSAVTGLDLVAANVSPAKFILGQERKPDGLDLSEVNPVLRRGGTEIGRGKFSDAMGDPWQSLLWLVNEAQNQGYAPVRGDVFLTGAMGGLIPALPGNHHADFGALGYIEFILR